MEVFFYNFYAMGTRLDILIPGINNDFGKIISNEIKDEVFRIEKLLNRFDPEGETAIINKTAYSDPVQVSDELWQYITQCAYYHEKTFGAFDIALWPIIEFWKYPRTTDVEDEEVQLDDQVKEKLEMSGFQQLKINHENKTVRFLSPIVELDFGGYGKGLAAEKISRILEKHQIHEALVNFGEDLVLAIGQHPQGKFWEFGIPHAYQPEEKVYYFRLRDKTLSSSGSYYEHEEKGHMKPLKHLISPYTGYPVDDIRTLCVQSPGSVEAEILSTALIVSPEPVKQDILANFPECSAIEIVYHNKKPIITPI